MTTAHGEPSGIYVHAPFCRRRCPFCSFAVTVRLDRRELWVESVLREIDRRAPDWPVPVDSVYFGGGTPSLLAPAQVARVFDAIRAAFDVRPGPEVTLESHPGDLGPGDLAALREAGVNRLSVGVQSFSDDDLRFLAREHDGATARRAVEEALAAGFGVVSLDLLYGLEGRPRGRWLEQIDRAADLVPQHVSAYLLTVEPGTVFRSRQRQGRLGALDPEEERDLLLVTRERLAANGYAQYEVSNYAREPRWRSRHNRKYWRGVPYLGLGPSAHSFRENRRWANEPSLVRYAERLGAGESPIAVEETLNDAEQRLERLFLGLRTSEGVPLELTDPAHAAALERDGLATVVADRLVLTPAGLAQADAIARELLG